MRALSGLGAAATISAFLGGCGSRSAPASPEPADASIDASDVFTVDGGLNVQMDSEATFDSGPPIRADRFAVAATYTPGACGGFGESGLPGVVLGPPVGAGDSEGSLDVVSLGLKGSIVLTFGDNAIVDGPGPDFLVFENVLTNGQPDYELAQVSVSDDGNAWHDFPCTATGFSASGYGSCAGWHPSLSSPTDGISPVDPGKAGGDPFDLRDLGIARARYVKITDIGVDYTDETCVPGSTIESDGFDLDAVSIVNALDE